MRAWWWALVAVALLWTPTVWASQSAALGCSSRSTVGLGLAAYVVTGQNLQVPAPSPKPEPSLPPDLVGKQLQLVIEAPSRRIYLFADGKEVRSWPVAVGTRSTPTPLGHWRIKAKAVWGGAFGARWMQLSIPWGTYGIHGTNNPGSIGTFASHGCIRMYNRDVVQLYSLVQVGTPVDIRGEPRVRFGEVLRVIVPTLVGSDVVQVQERLAMLDPGLGAPSGIFQGRWVQAVRAFQQSHGLPVTGSVDYRTALALGVVPVADDPSLRPTPKGQPVPPPPPR